MKILFLIMVLMFSVTTQAQWVGFDDRPQVLNESLQIQPARGNDIRCSARSGDPRFECCRLRAGKPPECYYFDIIKGCARNARGGLSCCGYRHERYSCTP
jgi:hypothetical protein